MNILDIVIILLLLLSLITGMKRGLLKEGVMLIGVIFIYIISFYLKDKIGLLLCKILPFFKFDGIVAINILIYQLIAFVLIASILFSIYSIVLKLTGIIQKLVDLTIILTIPSKILGAILGLIEGYIIIFIILITLSIPLGNTEVFSKSNLNQKIMKETPILSDSFNNINTLILDIYDVNSDISKKDVDKTNTKLLNMYLKYDILNKNQLNDIITTGKLDNISNIDKYKT